MINEGNLINDDAELSEVLASIKDNSPVTVKIELTERVVLTGVLNANPVVVNGALKWPEIKDREYGVLVHETSTALIEPSDASQLKSTQEYIRQEASSKITEDQIVVSKTVTAIEDKMKAVKDDEGNTTYEVDTRTSTTTSNAQTVITAEGITTGALNVNRVDVGTALVNVAALGNLSSTDINNLVNSGQAITSLDGRVITLETDVVAIDGRVSSEVERLDGRIDAELTANAGASTAYTDKKATETLDQAKEEDAKTLTSAQNFAKVEDAKILTAANTYTRMLQ